MRVGFLNNQIDNRGTGNAVFQYAHYNEALLGNESLIYTLPSGKHDPLSVERYVNRFNEVRSSFAIPNDGLDVLYHIKSGYNDGVIPPGGIKYAVHAVFDYDPHGDRYAMVSSWLANRSGLGTAYVPHIVDLPPISSDIRRNVGLPEDGVVFGRYGGRDTFDLYFVWEAIRAILEENPKVWFLFMNTDVPDWAIRHPRIVFVEPTANEFQKRLFINSCDAMIHARQRGETFGISVGEFAFAGKPIITYADSPEKAHLQELGHFALTYTGFDSVMEQFRKVIRGPLISWGYGQYSPENVMAKFNEVFLS